MRIRDLLKVEAIELGVSAANKEAAIDKLVALHDKVGNLADVAGYKAAILKRESESTTAIGEGLAVPHAKTAAAKHPGLAAITIPDGVDYDAPDGQPATLAFMIAAPEGAGDAHLEILSRLMVMLMDPDFGAALRAAKTPEEFLDIINKQEDAKSRHRRKRSPLSLPPQPPVPPQLLQLPQQKAPALSLSRPARPVSRIPTWQPKPSRRRAQRWASRSKSKPTAPAVPRTS